MNLFSYEQASNAAAAIDLAKAGNAPRYLGGGTNLVDLMREDIERPDMLIDITQLPADIEPRSDGSLLIGAAAKNTALAADSYVRSALPLLSRSILAGASAQIRNMATVGGNILQRTRCRYFYDDAAHCNKRHPGDGCDARDGFNRYHAILGASPSCVATHPSDMCVALAALDARLHLKGPIGLRSMPFLDLHRLPGERPDIETDLQPNELITAVEIPPLPFARRSTYRKVRDRASYAFALISVAAAVDIDEAGKVRDARLALGGVAHKPWRALKAEAVLKGAPANVESFRAAAEAELAAAIGLKDNGFKIELAKRTIVAVLDELKGEGA
ncbi:MULTISPECIES: xanthine dehydrogenase family protein subunit M [unclassified Rhizobium]|uniref:FAD binding domain-containing protein n=1 Tax=unclassified Rhizobium TaxID=2613769 RepID=UPI001469A666|nr:MULTISPECIES: xanthine dehydrogenase family protein subunit M [unclassified Rhizobium]MBB3287089.1 xanthine dehydrogenase YagS FAD-binding subunit [Rhizobium sp. BK252]MBB3401829.1 xanthine dehydrogenase YagS FAD-binding subunit [Rhizobium sp. BK289]MBB3414227.1 xanthine dehydrogenase YagS FAD-binding subunit [Rhizobium sp. BK284]MBB3482114.1 xanthine dehydrogenase YagS FAD-binding subunit [Rhizobium sp. BK347]